MFKVKLQVPFVLLLSPNIFTFLLFFFPVVNILNRNVHVNFATCLASLVSPASSTFFFSFFFFFQVPDFQGKISCNWKRLKGIHRRYVSLFSKGCCRLSSYVPFLFLSIESCVPISYFSFSVSFSFFQTLRCHNDLFP